MSLHNHLDMFAEEELSMHPKVESYIAEKEAVRKAAYEEE